LADNKRDQLGSWSSAGDWTKAVSLKEGMQNFIEARKKGIVASGKAPVTLLYSKGANILEDSNRDDRNMRAKLNKDNGNVDLDDKPAEQLLEEALEIAKKADTTVLALGESQGMSGEAASRMSLHIPVNQKRLLEKIRELYKGTNKKIVLVVYSGRPLVLTDESLLADSIVEAWFLGTQAGNALADVLFGAHNPSGKLTASFPYHDGQVLAHNYDKENTGRPHLIDFKYEYQYLDGPSDALFPFGWGLSYTTFDYTELKLSSKKPNQSRK
jgi:beta-glucosidase